jgi:hypothetical protein
MSLLVALNEGGRLEGAMLSDGYGERVVVGKKEVHDNIRDKIEVVWAGRDRDNRGTKA